MRWNLILADVVDLPRQNRPRLGGFSAEQARCFVKANAGGPCEALFALALTWKDVDLGRGTVRISCTLEWQKGGWQVADAPAKPAHDQTPELGSGPNAEGDAKTQDGCGTDFVFRAQRGGPIRESHLVRSYFKPSLKSAEVPVIGGQVILSSPGVPCMRCMGFCPTQCGLARPLCMGRRVHVPR